MRLPDLAAALNVLPSDLPNSDLPDVGVRGVTHNADWVRPGDVFVAIRGARFDGHAFLPGVASAGAVAVLGEGLPDGVTSSLPYLRVASARAALADAAAALAGHPSRELRVVGVTGVTLVSVVVVRVRRGRGRRGSVLVLVPGVAHALRMTGRARRASRALACGVPGRVAQR